MPGKVGNPFAASTTVTMDGDYSLQAHFAAFRCGLTLSSTKGGYINVLTADEIICTAWLGDGTYVFDGGSTLTVLAIPEKGYRFSHWTGTVWSTVNWLVFPILEDSRLTANFVPEVEVPAVGEQ